MKATSNLENWNLNEGASDEAIQAAMSALGHALPDDYVRFLRGSDGGEGFVGEQYLILWRAEELSQFNAEYEVAQDAPGLLLFGSNGGGEGYGFDTRDSSMKVVRVPFIGMEWRYATPVADGLDDLLLKLKSK